MKKLGAILLALALALSLGLVMAAPVAATTETIWTIGTFDDSRAEFNHTDFDGVDTATYDVATDDASDFPAFLYVSGYTGSWEEEGVHEVTINFSLAKDYWNVTLTYKKAGGETDEVSLDGGTPQTVTGPGENIFSTYNLSLGDLSAGSYYIVIECVSVGTGEGAHTYDALELSGKFRDIEKSVSSSDGYLGDIIMVTLDVENPSSSTLTVEDVIPDGLKYIPFTFEVDGSPVIPTIADNTISTTVGQGDFTITFNVQVVEVQCEDVTVTNWAYLYDGAVELDSDSEDITLHLYAGFEKVVAIVYEDNSNGQIEVNELVQWDMTITVPNNVGWVINNAVLKDNLGGELGMAGDLVNNDRVGGIDDNPIGDPAKGYNTIPGGYHGHGGLSDLIIKTKGKTKKVQFKIKDIDIGIGGSLDYVLVIFTDRNPSRWGQQCYTSTYEDHPLNSGATLKFTDPATGFKLSAHTCPILIDVVPPISPP